MTIDIMEHNTKSVFICCYAPTNVANETEKDIFYEELKYMIQRIPKSNNIILAGDFNARVGKNHSVWKRVLGKHGVGNTNENGLRLLQLCTLEDLTITNTCFQQKDKHKNTWKHPRSQHWHMIDFIIVRSMKMASVKKCKVMRSAQCETDHHLVRANIHLKPKMYITKKEMITYYNSRCLLNETIRQKFEDSIVKNQPINMGQNVEEA